MAEEKKDAAPAAAPEQPTTPKPPRWAFDPKTTRMVEGVPEPPVLLWETAMSVSQMVIIVVGVIVILLSVFSGAAWWVMALRAGAAMLTLTVVAWLFNWMIASGTLEKAQQDARAYVERQQPAAARAAHPPSTVEVEA